MNSHVAKYLVSIGALVFFGLIGDWFGVQYYRALSEPHLPLFVTRSLGGLGGFAVGLSWIRILATLQRYLEQKRAA